MLTCTYSHHIVEIKRSQEQHLFARTVGLKQYELTDASASLGTSTSAALGTSTSAALGTGIGNVRATVSDKLMVEEEQFPNSQISTFPNLLSSSTYYPYFDFAQHRLGMRIDALSGGDYRFGFNGMEMDNEVKGEGNSYDFGARLYDSQTTRFLSLDPLSSKYLWQSPYLFAANNPILLIDYKGLSGKKYDDKKPISVSSFSVSDLFSSIYDALGFNMKSMSSGNTVEEYDNVVTHNAEQRQRLKRTDKAVKAATIASASVILFPLTVAAAPEIGAMAASGAEATAAIRGASAATDFLAQFCINMYTGDDWKSSLKNINITSVGLSAVFAKPSLMNFAKSGFLSSSFGFSYSGKTKNVFNGIAATEIVRSTAINTAMGGVFRYGKYVRIQTARNHMNMVKIFNETPQYSFMIGNWTYQKEAAGALIQSSPTTGTAAGFTNALEKYYISENEKKE